MKLPDDLVGQGLGYRPANGSEARAPGGDDQPREGRCNGEGVGTGCRVMAGLGPVKLDDAAAVISCREQFVVTSVTKVD